MTETAAAPEPAEAVVQGSEHIQERGEEEAATPEAAPPEPDHAALLEELAAHIRTIAASGKKDIYEAVSWLASHGL